MKKIFISFVVILATFTSKSEASQYIKDLISKQIECQNIGARQDLSGDCNNIEEQFNQLLKLNNAEALIEQYMEDDVQMEMFFDSHSGSSG